MRRTDSLAATTRKPGRARQAKEGSRPVHLPLIGQNEVKSQFGPEACIAGPLSSDSNGILGDLWAVPFERTVL